METRVGGFVLRFFEIRGGGRMGFGRVQRAWGKDARGGKARGLCSTEFTEAKAERRDGIGHERIPLLSEGVLYQKRAIVSIIIWFLLGFWSRRVGGTTG